MLSRKLPEPALRERFRTRSAALRNVIDTVEKVLDHDVSILIRGESGTGKNFLAESIHAFSNRRHEPFIHVDCASIPADLFESELFGHERGTFTDAATRKIGRLELARGGTVLFDDLAALEPALQAKLLRALEERRFTRLGGNQAVDLRARVISSSGADLDAMMAAGSFRSDLFYRINVVTLTLPPLRERSHDIVPLGRGFLRKARRRQRFGDDALELLETYPWPGNIRQLRNVVDRAALLNDGRTIGIDALGLSDQEQVVTTAARGSWSLEQLERHYIAEVLRMTRRNYSRAAELLGINRKTLLEKRRKHGLG